VSEGIVRSWMLMPLISAMHRTSLVCKSRFVSVKNLAHATAPSCGGFVNRYFVCFEDVLHSMHTTTVTDSSCLACAHNWIGKHKMSLCVLDALNLWCKFHNFEHHLKAVKEEVFPKE